MIIKDYEVNSCEKKIAIYGNLIAAKITTLYLKKIGIIPEIYITDSGIYQPPFKNVISISCFTEKYKIEDYIILFSYEFKLKLSVDILESYGINEIYSVRNLWDRFDIKELCDNHELVELYKKRCNLFFFEDSVNFPDKVYINSLDAIVSERCSLKCENCSNLMQYYKFPKNHNVFDLIKSINIFLDKIDKLLELHILGGEPFMNMDFIKLVEEYAHNEKVTTIAIYSNATIFPEEKVLNALKDNGVLMRFSDYGSLSYKLKEWIKWCEKNNVNYVVETIELWQDLGKLARHENLDELELWDLYGTCECRNIPTIINNKLFNCPYSANAANLGAMYNDERERDELVLSTSTRKEQIIEFLYKRHYLEACRYCNGRNSNRARIKPYIQTKKVLDYEILDNKYSNKERSRIYSNNKITQNQLLSVVVPVYNARTTIERCVNSILNSRYKNIEIILVNDGSTDDSLLICNELMKNNDRIVVINNEHKGVVQTRNTGIKNAKGYYITFVDADDYVTECHYNNLIEQISDCDIVIGGYMMTNVYDKSDDPMRLKSGQGRYKKWENGVEVGVYFDDRLQSFKHNQFLYCRNINVFDFYLWNKIYKTDLVKCIYDQVSATIINGEDQLLYHLCLLKAQSVSVVKEYGYFHTESDYNNEKKYPYDVVIQNRVEEYQSIMKYIDENPGLCNEDLVSSIKEYYMQWLIDSIKPIAGNVFIKYPFYGKFLGKKIVLYGAGNIGKAYYKAMVEEAECELVAWIDQNGEKIRETTLLPVYDMNCISNLIYDYVVVSVSDKVAREEIKKHLIARGVHDEAIVWPR